LPDSLFVLCTANLPPSIRGGEGAPSAWRAQGPQTG